VVVASGLGTGWFDELEFFFMVQLLTRVFWGIFSITADSRKFAKIHPFKAKTSEFFFVKNIYETKTSEIIWQKYI